MRRQFIPALSLALVACSAQHETPFERAERRYDYLERHRASASELCDAAREAKDAAVDANADDTDYLTWTINVRLHCEQGLR